jgi:hypothetical protein
MQMVSPVLAAPTSELGSLSSPFLADGPGLTGVVTIILMLVIAVPLGLLIGAIPFWLAAKIAVPEKTSYGTAVKTLVSQLLAWLLIGALAFVAAMMAGAAGGHNVGPTLLLLTTLVMIVTNILIVAGAYGIGTVHAFGVQLLAGTIAIVFACASFFGAAAFVGMDGMRAQYDTSLQKIQDLRQAQQTGVSEPATTAPLPPPVTDFNAEIDNLLNAALHPDGPHPSLDERENIVRTLQEKLREQKSNVSPGDAHAMLVFQNQVNRYMALLETVKAERKLHPVRNEVITEQPTGRDYASPAQ